MPLAGIFSGLQISASGMRAQRIRQNAISSNLANAETSRTDDGRAVTVSIETGGAKYDVTATEIDAEVRADHKPTRIGIDLSEPAAKGRISLTIAPAR